ncbi:MAG: hypothetical protein QF615_00305, partial [Planctomycetota bacterium]|nr:hypothetical protein [Planctomycetota bacterium]
MHPNQFGQRGSDLVGGGWVGGDRYGSFNAQTPRMCCELNEAPFARQLGRTHECVASKLADLGSPYPGPGRVAVSLGEGQQILHG